MNIVESTIPYNYVTIKLTQSRINKGLLAIPVSLIDNFPKKRTDVMIYFDEGRAPIKKNFTPYESSSRECRIGGMKDFYDKNNAPPSTRRILADIYKGRCQLTDFSFLMKNGEPYFEIHHIMPNYGHHLKNLIVVCPNIHAQFEYAKVEEYFDEEGWLRRIKFNSQSYSVRQFVDNVQLKFAKEVHLLK